MYLDTFLFPLLPYASFLSSCQRCKEVAGKVNNVIMMRCYISISNFVWLSLLSLLSTSFLVCGTKAISSFETFFCLSIDLPFSCPRRLIKEIFKQWTWKRAIDRKRKKERRKDCNDAVLCDAMIMNDNDVASDAFAEYKIFTSCVAVLFV